MLGWQRWDERAFHCDRQGVMRPMSELWENSKTPAPLALRIRMARNHTVARSTSMAFLGSNDFRHDYEIL